MGIKSLLAKLFRSRDADAIQASVWQPGTDWGSYLYWDKRIQFDWQILVEKGLLFCGHKGDQEELAETGNYSTMMNLAAAREGGVLVNGCYYWLYAHQHQAYWIDRYKRAIERERPDFISVDWEHIFIAEDDRSTRLIDPQMAADHLLELCGRLREAFPELPFLLYTRPDVILNNTTPAIPYLDEIDFWMAGWPDYGSTVYPQTLEATFAGDMRQVWTYKPLTWNVINLMRDGFTPPLITAKTRVLIWQTSSRIIPTYPGKTPPAFHQYDFNFWLGSRESMLAWAKQSSGGGTVTPPVEPPLEVNVAAIHNKLVAQKDRAKIVTIEHEQKPTVGYGDLGADALILPMGGMPLVEGYCRPQAYTSFAGRCAEAIASVPVIGQFELDAGNCTLGELSAATAQSALKDNPIVKALIDGWHDGAWTWDKILTGKGKWRNIAAIEFKMVTDAAYPPGMQTSNVWQTMVLGTMLERVKYLQDGGYAPKIPVILYTGCWWLDIYDMADFGALLQSHKDWLYLRLGLWTLKSTATFDNLSVLFGFRPSDTFTYGHVPEGYGERILAHEFTGETQKCRTLIDASGNPTPVSLSLWCDTRAAMHETLKFGAVTPPPIEPPVEPPTSLTELIARVTALETRYNELIAWLASCPK